MADLKHLYEHKKAFTGHLRAVANEVQKSREIENKMQNLPNSTYWLTISSVFRKKNSGN